MSTSPTAKSDSANDFVAALLARNFRTRGGELLIGELPVSQVAAEFGTPLFVYDEALLARQYDSLREALPPRFEICYSVKANPNQAILRFFVSRGCGLEIASSGELLQALAAGCPAENILFAGPGKTEAEIDAAVAAGIGEIHVESLIEARRIAAAATRHGRQVDVALRVNPAADVQGGGMRMGAKPAPFGIDEDQLNLVLTEILAESALRVVGLHLYVGTQILDADTLIAQYRAGLDIARSIARQTSRPLRTVDLGGGLGIPYFARDQHLDLHALHTGLVAIDHELAADPLLGPTRFVIEPGRFLVGPSGVYIARVTDVKISRGKRFVVTDGGMHHHLAASGNLGQTIKRNFPVALVNKLDQPAVDSADVVGPLCTPLDVLARNLPLPEVAVGDLVAVLQSGAYARAASPLGFLSRQAPPEVIVRAGRAELVRRRGTDQDYLADQPDSAVGGSR